jgi:hypothetical protein
VRENHDRSATEPGPDPDHVLERMLAGGSGGAEVLLGEREVVLAQPTRDLTGDREVRGGARRAGGIPLGQADRVVVGVLAVESLGREGRRQPARLPLEREREHDHGQHNHDQARAVNPRIEHRPP